MYVLVVMPSSIPWPVQPGSGLAPLTQVRSCLYTVCVSVLEPGQPVQTTLYDGKLYTLTITGQQELETTVRIVKVMGGESHQREDQLRCLESLGQLKLRA